MDRDASSRSDRRFNNDSKYPKIIIKKSDLVEPWVGTGEEVSRQGRVVIASWMM